MAKMTIEEFGERKDRKVAEYNNKYETADYWSSRLCTMATNNCHTCKNHRTLEDGAGNIHWDCTDLKKTAETQAARRKLKGCE